MKRILALLLAITFVFSGCAQITTDTDSNGSEDSQTSDNLLGSDDEYEGETRYTLISTGKPYTSSAAAYESYQDFFGQQLTDGITTPDTGVHYTDTRMVGYTQSSDFTIDLGDDGKRISAIAVRCLDISTDGVLLADSLRVSGSDNGKSFSNIGMQIFEKTGDQTVSTAYIKLDELVNYRYVRVHINKSASAHFYFIDEIQIFACVAEKEKVNTAQLAYLSASLPEPIWKDYDTRDENPKYVKNIAKGMTYSIADCDFDTRAPKNEVYLTDDANTGRLFGEDVWVGIKGSSDYEPSVTVDFSLTKAKENIFAFKVHALGAGIGVSYPDYIDVYGKTNDTYGFLGRMYAPTDVDNYAYTLILPVYINLKSVRFLFPKGENTYWIEEIQVFQGSDTEYIDELYPPLDFDEVTEDVYWPSSDADYNAQINLIKGNTQQIANSVFTDPLVNTQQSPWNSPTLTDGKRAISTYCYSGEWFFAKGGGALDIIYDLTCVSAVSRLNVSLLEQTEWGISRPSSISVYLSQNGDDWYNVGNYSRPADEVLNVSATRLEFPFRLDKTYKARYVMFRIESAMLFVDELECFGTKNVSDAVSLADSGIKAVPYHINPESKQFATLENTDFGASDIVITYPNSTTPEGLRGMLAYLDEDGNIKDTFMDGLLLCNQGALPSGALPYRENRKYDWESMCDVSFNGKSGFDVIESTLDEIKSTLNIPDYTVSVYISIPTIYETVTDFGDVDGDGVSESLAFSEDRKRVISWYIDLCTREFQKRGYKNIVLGGFYWLNEGVNWEMDDSHIIAEVGEVVHQAGQKFFWVPYYTAHRYANGYNMNFDLVCMQPNYVFTLKDPFYRLEHTPELAQRYQMSVEIEHSYQCLSDPDFARRYMLYLYYGVTTGYIDAIHVYYDDLENFGEMAISDDTLCRLQYDATYHFAKGDLEITPKTMDTQRFEASADSVFYSSIKSENEYSLFTLVSSTENGYISLAEDGSFAYYPNHGFAGTDKFTYTYNNLLGESEECTVEINVK